MNKIKIIKLGNDRFVLLMTTRHGEWLEALPELSHASIKEYVFKNVIEDEVMPTFNDIEQADFGDIIKTYRKRAPDDVL